LGHPSGAASAHGHLARDQGDIRRAALAFQEMLRLWADVDTRYSSVRVLAGAGEAPVFPHWASIDDRRSLVRALAGLAEIAAGRGLAEQAAALVGAVDVRIRELDAHSDAPDRANHARAAAAARVALGEERFAELCAAGRALPLAAAVASALAIPVPDAPAGEAPRPPWLASADALTARERDVLRLLVEGRSNAEIAEALFVGAGTVKTHVANILAKLGVPTRAAAATHAVRQGLV
jgi:DNA-binding NarL/FixJ family response regulator